MSKKFSNLIFILLVLIIGLCGCNNKKETENTETKEEIKEEVIQEKPITTTASFSVVGDIMVHSYQYEEAYNSETKTYDFSHNFTEVKKYFEGKDLVIGNLETVFAGEEVGISDYPCFNTPDSFLDTLKDAGFNLVTTANNHCMDKGKNGLLRTIQKLDEKGISHVGTYASQEESEETLIKEINGIKFAFVSFTYGTNGINVPDPYLVNVMSEQLVKEKIQKAKAENPDFVVVMPHMGNEYELYVRDVFKNWADLMFESGADIILASHPHVLQPMEMRTLTDKNGNQKTGFIIYSLGNFISSQTTPPRNAGVILNMDFEKTDGIAKIKKISVVPVWTQFRIPSGRNYFQVRSVYDIITMPEEQQKTDVRPKDLNRVRDIHYETTKMLLNKDIPIENIQEEYTFYEG